MVGNKNFKTILQAIKQVNRVYYRNKYHIPFLLSLSKQVTSFLFVSSNIVIINVKRLKGLYNYIFI